MKLRHNDMADFTLRAEKILQVAADLATKQQRSHIGTEHIVEALLLEKDGPHIGVLHDYLERELVVHE